MRQTTRIFDMGATFTLGLINIIKKVKSLEMKSWIKHQVDQLIAPIKRHIKVTRVGRSWHKRVLKIINRYWGLKIIGFFCTYNESEKTFCQLVHLYSSCFPYFKVWRLVNNVVVERLLTSTLYHSFWYDLTTADWDATVDRCIIYFF